MKYFLVIIAFLFFKPNSINSSNKPQSIAVYSGTCTQYKKVVVGGNKLRYDEVSRAFGKVVLNRTSKKFSFYFDGKLIHSSDGYLSYRDDNQGGEGFSLINGFSAHYFPAERSFQIYYSPGMGDPGYTYEINNYRVN